MKRTSIVKVVEGWRGLQGRDQLALIVLAMVLAAALLYTGAWQSMQSRLALAQRGLLDQQALALRIEASLGVATVRLPAMTSSQVRSSAVEAGLQVAGLELRENRLHLSVSGDALALLDWLTMVEVRNGHWASLLLEKRGEQLHAAAQLQLKEGQ